MPTRHVVQANAVIAWEAVLVRWPLILELVLVTSCVPQESSETPSHGAPTASSRPVAIQKWRPKPSVRQKSTIVDEMSDSRIATAFHDDFERPALGSDWLSTTNQWQLQSGELCAQSARNHPVWLKRRLPINANISFRARALTSAADLKVEAWGNGRSHASGSTYDDATGYVFIFGGWRNQFHVLARLDEHASNRLELRLHAGATDPRYAPVVANQDYRFELERRDGRTVVWLVDDVELFRMTDDEPLQGKLHDHFGFNDWESPVCFDDLTIVPLPE